LESNCAMAGQLTSAGVYNIDKWKKSHFITAVDIRKLLDINKTKDIITI